MQQVRLRILDNISVEVLSGEGIVKECLSYNCEFWRQGPRGKVKQVYQRNFVFGDNKKGYWTYVGNVERIKEWCEKRSIPFQLIGELEYLTPLAAPTLQVDWRPGQLETVLTASRVQRGVILFAPGVGKTTTAVGIVSCFPKRTTVLFLCHEIGLVQQAYNRFIEAGYDSVSIVSGKKKAIETDIVIATNQTYKNLDLLSLSSRFSIIFVDECHHGVGKDSNIEKILSTSLAPVRIGLSATPAKEKVKAMVVEGLLGGTILGKIGIQEGIELGILSKPTIKLISVPEKKGVNELKSYQKIYDAGIVNYQIRNKIIAQEANKLVKEGKSVLIFCERKIHLDNVAAELEKFNIKFITVQGETEGGERIDAKNMLGNKEIDCILASRVFVAGMDCPSLDAIINATGLKGETALIQKVGRALRVADGKNGATIIDLLDPFNYLAQHCVQRLSIYAKNGWL